MKSQSLLCLSLLAFLGACNSSSDSSKAVTNPTNETTPIVQSENKASQFEVKYLGPKTKLAEDFSNIDQFADDLNTHLIDIKALNGVVKQGQVHCTKSTAGELNADQYSQFSSTGLASRLTLFLNPSDPATVRFTCRVQDEEGNTLHQFDQHLKKNIVINSKEAVTAIGQTEVETLLIMDEGELITEGTNFSLKIKNLISYKGKISTYDLKTVRSTPALKDGLSGGEIRLHITKAMGDLTLNLRGTNGGEQTHKTTRPPQQPKAAKGRCNARSGRGCDGQNGLSGLPAQDGADGYAGGSSGFATIKIEEKSDFEVIYNIQSGLGSKGVPASLPGLGGEGGDADILHGYDPCGGGPTVSPVGGESIACGPWTLSGKKGQDGTLGAKGIDGINGADGEIKESQFINLEEGIHELILSSWSSFRGNI